MAEGSASNRCRRCATHRNSARAADIMIGDASDDVFADFRSWVISRGRKAYEHIVASPDEGLAELDLDDEAEQIGDGELFGAVIGQVYGDKIGIELYDAFPDRHSADFPHLDLLGSQKSGSRKERHRLYPRLSAKYSSQSQIRFPWRD